MGTAIIITICVLLLFAYVFDITAAKTKVPTVILLLLLGYMVKQISIFLDIDVPDLSNILPLLGTVGLILIVLEGALELEFNPSKFKLIKQSTLSALLPMIIFCAVVAFIFQYSSNVSFKTALVNAIPLAVISSAIAIPSVQNLAAHNREFVIYESSLSDIFGVLLFNFIALNEQINGASFGKFLMDIVIIIIISIIATMALSYLLSKIKHPVKYAPIVLMILLIYSICKIYHLPGLIFILFFGLFLGNIDEVKNMKLIQRLKPEVLNKEVHKFRELVVEMTFLVRALFFLVFGSIILTDDLINTDTILWAIGICAGIFILRYLTLRLLKIDILPLTYVAPRGLITILLFLSIPISDTIAVNNKSLIIQIIIITAIVMMIGIMKNDKIPIPTEAIKEDDLSNSPT